MTDDDKTTRDEQSDYRPGVEGWDRYGEYLERWGQAGTAIAQRHLNFWKDVSASLRDPQYGADSWARDGARLLTTAMDDAQDLWRGWAAQGYPPAGGGIRTVLLVFEVDVKKGTGEDTLPSVQYIGVPRSVKSPPARAQVALE